MKEREINMKMTNRIYDYVQIGVTVILPAVGGAYGVISQTWNLPYSEEIVTTIAAITACGSLIIKGISKQYHMENDST